MPLLPKRLITSPLTTLSEVRMDNALEEAPMSEPSSSIFKTALVPVVRVLALAPGWL